MILFFSFEARLLFFQQNDIHTNLHIFHMLLYVKILYIQMTQCYTLNNIWFAYEISQLQTPRRESWSKIVLFSSGVTFDNSDTGCQIFLNMAHNQLPWWSHNNYSHSSKSLSMLSVNVDFLCWQILTLILVSPCWMLTFSSVSFTVSIPRILETWQHSDCKIKKKLFHEFFPL